MTHAQVGSVELCFDTHGDPDDPALLLIMGLGAQMTLWDIGFVTQLVEAGHHVIRFDNRDVGLSAKTEGPPPDMAAVMTAAFMGGQMPSVPYSLSDMAADAVGVLDHLGIDAAHIVGASLGGMIAQMVAIEHPARVLSLTSIMSTTGDTSVGQSEPNVLMQLIAPLPEGREAVIERGVELSRAIAGPLFDEARSREIAGVQHDRSFNPVGPIFQMAAMAATGDRTERLRDIDVPTLVIHGKLDPLVGFSGGEATAAAVRGAELLAVEEMGHDLPEPLWPRIVAAISALTSRSR